MSGKIIPKSGKTRAKGRSSHRLLAAAIGACVLGLTAAQAHAGLTTDNILVNNFGDTSGTPNIQEYTPAGTLVQTYTGTGYDWEGATVTPSGLLVTTRRHIAAQPTSANGINVFDNTGTQVATFGTPEISSTKYPGDISVFADNTLAVSDQNNGTHVIRKYSLAGVHLGDITLPVVGGVNDTTFGSTISPTNTLWMSDPGDGKLYEVNESGTLLSNLSLPFLPLDMIVAPDSTLWVTENHSSTIHHLQPLTSTTFNALTSITAGFEALGIAMDSGGDILVTGPSATTVERYSTTTGFVNSFSISSPDSPIFLNVVPVPEPGAMALMLLAVPALLRRRRA